MSRFFLTLFFVFGISLHINAQRANVLATFQFIENGKYTEAKEAIEEAIKDRNTAKWWRTWYARGLLCLDAYEVGIKDNEKKKYELYPDQLYVAYDSFEKSIQFSRSDRIHDQLKPHYVRLLNDFITLGTNHYKQKNYEEAVRAFDHGLRINQSEVLSVELDTSLLYNTAIAAYQSGDEQKALEDLSRLNSMRFSPNVSKLIYTIHLHNGDSLKARDALTEGIGIYSYDKDLVLLLTDILFKLEEGDEAIQVLDKAIQADTSNAIFFYTKGLVYQKTERYGDAISAYEVAAKLDPDNADIFKNMGTCYYNIGVEYDENARSITNNRLYQEEKNKSRKASLSAVKWLEKAYQLRPSDSGVREMLTELYTTLNMKEKLNRL